MTGCEKYPMCLLTAALLYGCVDSAQSPPTRSERQANDGPAGSELAPVDLVYICGNKFLATNSTPKPVHVEYRVVGTSESGSLTLPEGSRHDPPQSETELETRVRGAVELYQDGERVVRRPNESLPCGPSASLAAAVAGATAGGSGEWSPPFPTPVVAMHLNLLPTGKLLFWGVFGVPHIWDPESGSFTAVPSPALLFCSGHSFLGDGRLLVSGGHIAQAQGLPDNTIFDPEAESWSQSMPMRRGRWYPTNTTLANGDVVILAGKDQGEVPVEEPEVWSSGTVRMLGSATQTLPYYPRTFLAPDGKIFYAGELKQSRYLDPSGGGGWSSGPWRRYGTRSYGAAVMYDEGKILYAGGGYTTNTAEIIDINAAAPTWEWTGSMAFARRHLNATVLPTGEVLVTGGTSGTVFNDLDLAVRAAELWNPATGTWTTLASNAVNRGYHSTSILLPDGRVLHGGSGAREKPYEHSFELFSPPYLMKGPRPAITGVPSRVGYGASFTLTTPDASDIARISLIRLGSVTHAFDMNQRFQWLPFTREADGLSVSGPVSRNRTPPGHYLLFILNAEGVPSVGRIIRVELGAGDAPPPPPPNAAPTTAFTWSCDGLTCSFTDGSTDDVGVVSWSWSFGDDVGTSIEASPVYPFVTEGSYEVTLTATDAEGLTGTLTRTISVTAVPPNETPTANFGWSCAALTCTFADQSTDRDGRIASWSWSFGDGATSTQPSPSRSYASAGSYEVTLTVTDDGGATAQKSASVTPTAPLPITLSVTGRQEPTKQYMALTWSGASGTMVDVYRNGVRIIVTENDGKYTNSRQFTGSATYTYKLCQAGTTTCSNEATVTLGTAAPPSIKLSATGRVEAGKQYMALSWTGATGTMVDVYRNGVLIKVTENDGKYTNSRQFTGAATYGYKVCQAGTAICSNEARVTFS